MNASASGMPSLRRLACAALGSTAVPLNSSVRRGKGMRTKIIIAMIALVTTNAMSGDYLLTIANTQSTCIPPSASRENESWPIRSSSEIANDMVNYFSGGTPKLGLFVSAFQNGRIRICGNAERQELYHAFLTSLKLPKIAHEANLYDYMMMLGSEDLLQLLDSELQHQSLSNIEISRIRHAKESVKKGLKLRDSSHA